jgi:uncharacterized protein (TIGR04255 family)
MVYAADSKSWSRCSVLMARRLRPCRSEALTVSGRVCGRSISALNWGPLGAAWVQRLSDRLGPSCGIWLWLMHPHLPNSPLVAVSFEVRFHGDLNLITRWGEFQKAVRSDFQKLYVVGAVPGTSPLLQPIKLSSVDNDESILLTISSFAYTANRYHTFVEFRQRLLEIHRQFFHLAGPAEATRFGLRYVNILPPASFDAGERGVIHPALKLALGGADIAARPQIGQPQLTFERAIGNLVLRVSIGAPPSASQASDDFAAKMPGISPGVLLDLDCYQVGPGRAEEMATFLDAAHGVVDNAFLGLVSASYYEYMKGGL